MSFNGQYHLWILFFYLVSAVNKLFHWQENIRRCVCIIYDPSRSNQGVLALKALKLSDSFMELYRNNNFTGEKYDVYDVLSCIN